MGNAFLCTLVTVEKLLSTYPSLNSFCAAGLGEPTLCQSFCDIVDFLRRSGRYVGVITNGVNLSPLLDLAHEPNYLSISLKGYDNKSYFANTGVAAFDKVINTFTRIRQRIQSVGFSYFLTRENYSDLTKVLAVCDELEPSFLDLINYLAYDPTCQMEVDKVITVRDTDIIHNIEELCKHRDYIRTKPIYIDYENPMLNCQSYDYLINLDGDGNIGGCMRQIPPNASFGNIFLDSDPFNSYSMRKRRNQMHKRVYVHEECRFCFGNWDVRIN